jgi:hypothetical protein
MFDKLTITEWDALCSKLERAMRTTQALVEFIKLPWVGAPYRVLDDLYAVHGDLMLGWQARAVSSGTGWPA